MSEMRDALCALEIVAECFYEKFRRSAADVIGERLMDVDVPGRNKEIALFHADSLGDLAVRDELSLAYGMNTVQVAIKTPDEQQRGFIEYGVNTYSPDINVSMYDADSDLAQYGYDRSSGLVVVNNYEFAAEEFRPITDSELNELGMSINGANLQSVARDVLTLVGVTRLTQDLAIATTHTEP